MRYFFDEWGKIKKKLMDKFLFLFLDYDGTLTPIVKTPDKAFLSEEAKELLKKLAKVSDCPLAIISGGALKDIKSRVGLKGIIYVGNHGLEIEGPKIKFESQISPRLKSIIRHIYEDARSKFSRIKGVLIEDKGLTISIHYRLVDKKDIPELKRILAAIVEPYIVRNKIKINSGKKVYEIKPPVQWDKGKVVLWLMARQQFVQGDDKIFPIYIGDDNTDEDAFRALKNKGIAIFVGRSGKSEAQYYLKNTQEVAEFIRRITELKKRKICQN